jgi:CubicO group peptidase (beta-lactamase class C family)
MLRYGRRRRARSLTVVAVAFLGCRSAPPLGELPPGAVEDSGAATRFVAGADSLRQGARIPGLAIAIVRDTTIVLARGLGYADVERRISTLLPYGIGWFVEEHEGEELLWHTGLWEEKYSALYLKVPARKLTLNLLANSDGLRWEKRLDEGGTVRSPFARAFLDSFR